MTTTGGTQISAIYDLPHLLPAGSQQPQPPPSQLLLPPPFYSSYHFTLPSLPFFPFLCFFLSYPSLPLLLSCPLHFSFSLSIQL
mmetsp:Transcript_36128/g.95010  ORF Transcript_36128/g.95010 Transcript_36128/m.95010 type:complete len:84 (+) Transcript_36128:164-415(+)